MNTNCKAKITGEWGSDKCTEPATKRVTITTFAPHLQREVKKVRELCDKHASRLLHRHRYQIKHCGKKTTLNVEEIK